METLNDLTFIKPKHDHLKPKTVDNIKENKIIGILLNDEINDNKSFNSYLMNIYYSLYSHMYDEIDTNNIIIITIKNCNISTFKINKKDIQNMIDIGYQKTIEYFKTKNNQ